MRKQKIKFENRIAKIALSVLFVIAVLVVGGLVMSDMTSTNVMAAMSIAALPLFMIDGKFKELSETDYALFVKEATAEQLAGYINSLNNFKRQEIKDLIAKGEKDNKESIDKLKADFTEMKLKQFDVMEKALEKQGLTIQKLLDEKKVKDSMTTFDQIKSELTKNETTLKALKKGDKVDFTFNVKVAGTMLESTNLTGTIPAYQRIPGVNFIAQRVPFILDLISRGVATSNVIEWVEEVAGEGAADYTAEGVKKNQIDADFKTDSEKIQKLTVFVKVSEEMIADIDFMASYINNKLLTEKLQLKLDAEVLSGVGGGSAINGILTQATVWAAGSFAGMFTLPTAYHAIVTAINQIRVAHFNPNYVVLHPTDLTLLELATDTLGRLLFPTLSPANGGNATLAGLTVITNTGMTEGTFLVMDGTKATAYFKEGITIKTGWESDDFVKNLRTILAEVRMAIVIEGNDVGAFVTGSFATAIEAITKVTN